MKITILLCISFLSGLLSATAQINKGTVWLGGNIGFNTEKNKFGNTTNANNTSIFINPSFSKAVKENTLVGASLSYSFQKAATSPNIPRNTGYGVGVFLRKYKPLSKSFLIYAQPGLTINYNYFKQTGFDNGIFIEDANRALWTFVNLEAGISYVINTRLLVEANLGNLVQLGYRRNWTERLTGPALPKNSNNIFFLNSGLTLRNLGDASIGLRFLLNKKSTS